MEKTKRHIKHKVLKRDNSQSRNPLVRSKWNRKERTENKTNILNKFVICINNKDYPVSLIFRKIYMILPDSKGEKEGMLRIIDESEEDYLYPQEYFIPIKLPEITAKLLKTKSTAMTI
jgi:hypothetical protein